MNKIHKLLGFGFICLLTVSACGTNSETFNTLPETAQISAFERPPVNNNPVIQIFLKNVSRLGVQLGNNELKEISLQRHVPPSGLWASRPAMNLTSDQNLNVHFIKHRNEFKGI